MSTAEAFVVASARKNSSAFRTLSPATTAPLLGTRQPFQEEVTVETIMSRVETLRRGLALVSGYALVAGVLSIVLSISAMAEGEAYGFTRAAIGLVGIAAGLLVFTGKEIGIDGWRVLVLWSALQVPVYADTKGGNLFRQLVDLPAAFSSSTTINGVVTEYSQIGFNLVGVALLIVVYRLRDRWNISQRSQARALAAA